tara:strand:+ start:6566 stop:7306 length:741 start_codon:yes stop_codon:yes gene_type:complete
MESFERIHTTFIPFPTMEFSNPPKVNKCSICFGVGHQSRTCTILTARIDNVTNKLEDGESWTSIKDSINEMIKEQGISTTRKIATGVVNKIDLSNEVKEHALEKIKETRKTKFLYIFEDIYRICHPSNRLDVTSDDFDIFEYSDMLFEENQILQKKVVKKHIKMKMTSKENNWINTDVCGICLDETNSKSSVALGCNHGFCASCVSEILKREHTNCPSCRQEVNNVSFCKSISPRNYNLIQDAIYS